MDSRVKVALVIAGVLGIPVLLRLDGDLEGYSPMVMDRLRSCPEARARLGDNIEQSYLFACGQTSVEGANGNATLVVRVSGSRASGAYSYAVEKHGGVWEMTQASLDVEGETIDVLKCAAPRTAAPPAADAGVWVVLGAADAGPLDVQCGANVAAACLALGVMAEQAAADAQGRRQARAYYDRACALGLSAGCAMSDRLDAGR
jgi:hypothetical protein